MGSYRDFSSPKWLKQLLHMARTQQESETWGWCVAVPNSFHVPNFRTPTPPPHPAPTKKVALNQVSLFARTE